jgi:hypothetical protein
MFVICLHSVYLTVVSVDHLMWSSGFRISSETCAARDISDVP